MSSSDFEGWQSNFDAIDSEKTGSVIEQQFITKIGADASLRNNLVVFFDLRSTDGMPDQSMNAFRQIFKLIDVEDSGVITREEYLGYLELLGKGRQPDADEEGEYEEIPPPPPMSELEELRLTGLGALRAADQRAKAEADAQVKHISDFHRVKLQNEVPAEMGERAKDTAPNRRTSWKSNASTKKRRKRS